MESFDFIDEHLYEFCMDNRMYSEYAYQSDPEGDEPSDIKRVFSIWICMNMKDNSLSHIHLTKDEMLKPYDWKGNIDLLNIVLIGITNELPEHDEKYKLHRLIGALLSSGLNEQQKLDIIEQEYNIPVSQEFREEVKVMCNLSTGIEERTTKEATEETSEKFILNMHRKGYTLDQIADVAETSVDEIEAVIRRKETIIV